MGSTFWLMSKLSEGKKVSIDIEPRQSIIHHFMHGEDWRFFQGDSHTEEMYNNVKNFCPQYDFIFIDGDHSYDGVKKDFELYSTIMSENGIITIHDTYQSYHNKFVVTENSKEDFVPFDGPCKFIKELEGDEKWNLVNLKNFRMFDKKVTSTGLALLTRKL